MAHVGTASVLKMIATFKSVGGTILASISAVNPVVWVAVGTVVIIGGVVYLQSKTESKGKNKKRVNSPIGRRNNYSSRKKAKEAAKRAGGGKNPIHHPKGCHGNPRPHYHPNVKNNYRSTPHGVSSHDHYYYPGQIMKVNKLVEEEIIKNFVVKNRQERILWELASSKKRDQTFWRFAGPGIFKNECLEKLNYMSPDELESYLLAFIQTEQVYYLGEMYIGKTTIK